MLFGGVLRITASYLPQALNILVDMHDTLARIALGFQQRSRCFPAGFLDQPFYGWVAHGH